jgi:hypothetical protein
MVAKGYTSALLVAQELGIDLTGPQLDQCADLVAEAEAFIDHETGRAWSATSPTVDELHTLTGPLVYLVNRPVVSVTAVKSRPIYVGGTDTTLTAGVAYELVDATNGILLVNSYANSTGDVVTGSLSHGSLLKVSYTSSTPVPGDIQRAATLLVAHTMLPRLNPDRHGVESYNVGGELQVKLRADDVPPEVLRIIRAREAVIFA